MREQPGKPGSRRYQQAASHPKELRWYAAGHALNCTARQDMIAWLARHIRINPSGTPADRDTYLPDRLHHRQSGRDLSDRWSRVLRASSRLLWPMPRREPAAHRGSNRRVRGLPRRPPAAPAPDRRRHSGRLLGAQLVGHHDAEVAKRIDIPAGALFHHMTVDGLSDLDLSYTPPFGSPWDAIQLAAQAWSTRACRAPAAASPAPGVGP